VHYWFEPIVNLLERPRVPEGSLIVCYFQNCITQKPKMIEQKTTYWAEDNDLGYNLVKVSCQNLEWPRLSDVINYGKIHKIESEKSNFLNLILRV